MFVTALINAVVLLQASAMSKHIRTVRESAEDVAAVEDVQPRQILALDEKPLLDADMDLIRLKDEMRADADTGALDDVTEGYLEPRIFLSVPTASQEEDKALNMAH